MSKTGLLLALTVVLAGCTSSGALESGELVPYGEAASPDETIEIRVVNLNYSDARLYLVVRRGHKRPLGTVTGKDDDTFTVPWEFSAPAALEIDLVGGGRCTSDLLTLDPGDWVDFQIPVAFQVGSACRW